MISAQEALSEQISAAHGKVTLLRSPARYLVSSALAGAYVGVAVVLMFEAAGPLNTAHSPWTKLVQGLVFGIALTLVVFAGAELSTGNMMTMVHGLFDRVRGCGPGGAAGVIVASFLGNLVGAVLFALLVYAAGVLAIHNPGEAAPGAKMLAGLITSKAAESPGTLFFRGVLCNFLVCLGVWMAARTKSDAAKVLLIFWVLLAFVSSGFEHVVANMTVYTLGMLSGAPGATIGHFAGNLLFSGLGNLVGGGLLVGAAYGLLAHQKAAKAQKHAAAEETATDRPSTVSV